MSKRYTRLEVHEGPDREGKYLYSLYWMTDYVAGHPDGENKRRERGQCFRAKLPDLKEVEEIIGLK